MLVAVALYMCSLTGPDNVLPCMVLVSSGVEVHADATDDPLSLLLAAIPGI